MQRTNWYHVKSILKQTWRHPSNADHRARSTATALAWQVEKRLRRRPRDVDFYGLTLRCYPDSQSASNVVYFTERYDPAEMRFLEAYLRPGDWFVDAGANIGTYSLLARSLVGASGRVDGFEPHPVAARRFAENVQINGLDNVVVHQAAVGSEPGMVDFIDGADVSNRVKSSLDPDRPTIEVPVVTLDQELAAGRYAMGKIDVEGYETAALAGAANRLGAADPPVWQIELLEHQLVKAGSSRSELIDLLDRFGYGFAEFGSTGAGGVVRLRWVDPAECSGTNLWAVHRGSVAAVEERLGSPIVGSA